MLSSTSHSFHIPVMGLAFTIDSPIKVARFGISSVISIIEDNLIEKMRCHYYKVVEEHYNPISTKEHDYRAKRITDYLNLVNRIVKQQVEELKTSVFKSGSEIDKYFEMLPDNSDLKRTYEQKSELSDPQEIQHLEHWLRNQIQPGSIDVNIMTKLDKPNTDRAGDIVEDGSDAVVAVRGYSKSNLLNSSIVLSAGMNPRLFKYMETLDAFDADSNGDFEKKIVIKVSDYRSAFIQGKMLAKKGIWVSEFRIESGLNCGGHAFATDGLLLGPILEEFKSKKQELITTLFEIYNQALKDKKKASFEKAHQILITAQGGLGTNDENELLRRHYQIDKTGWGTPFLLVPEATTVDKDTLQLLSKAKEQDVFLSNNSPLGIRFHYLKGTTSDKIKLGRIEKDKPGSPCTEKFLISNTEFTTEPICTASHSYQKKKIAQLKTLDLSQEEYTIQAREVMAKECLCIGLSNAAITEYKLQPFKNQKAVTICPGPNIAYFTEIVSLQKMINHIYGRSNIIQNNNRPHMFIKELTLYIDFWEELVKEKVELLSKKQKLRIQKFYNNLNAGISYYRDLIASRRTEDSLLSKKFKDDLNRAEAELENLHQYYLIKTLEAA